MPLPKGKYFLLLLKETYMISARNIVVSLLVATIMI